MKRDVCISILHNLSLLLALDAEKRSDKQLRSIAKLKARVRDAYKARRPDNAWWRRDVEQHAERKRVLEICVAYTGPDEELRRINDARRKARQEAKEALTSDARQGTACSSG